MDEYILRTDIQEAFATVTSDRSCPLHIAAEIDQTIAHLSAANVEPVKFGRWKGDGMGDYYCSLCGESFSGCSEWKRCPACEAKMQ